mgnify:CR=1 FL=1
MKKLLRLWYKLSCEHDFYMDKQITRIKCRECGYSSWVLSTHKADLYPKGVTYGIEAELKSKTLFE